MKKLFFTVAVVIILLSSCRNKANKKPDTHVHDDGTEHVNHDNDTIKAPAQESFEVDIDSLQVEKDTLKNEHEGEHSHSHEDGHEHTH
jgi:hypothetical protein